MGTIPPLSPKGGEKTSARVASVPLSLAPDLHQGLLGAGVPPHPLNGGSRQHLCPEDQLCRRGISVRELESAFSPPAHLSKKKILDLGQGPTWHRV